MLWDSCLLTAMEMKLEMPHKILGDSPRWRYLMGFGGQSWLKIPHSLGEQARGTAHAQLLLAVSLLTRAGSR